VYADEDDMDMRLRQILQEELSWVYFRNTIRSCFELQLIK
jgi:hypothetical protein